MGVGLGKNSPVVLSLGKENYEALITRHGQWIRWRTAEKCTCIKKNTFAPDIHCKKCGGRGWLYSYQKSQEKFVIVMVTDNSGCVELDDEYIDCDLIGVYNMNNEKYDQATKVGNYILLNSEKLPIKSDYLTVILSQKLEKLVETTKVVQIGDGYYKLSDLSVNKTGIDGLYYNAPCDIVEIESIVDANGRIYEPKELRQNQFYIEPQIEVVTDEITGVAVETEIPIENPIQVQGVKYLEPFTFVLLNQNLSPADAQDVVEAKGDAVLTFPFALNVSQNDVITSLVGTYTNKEVVNRMAKDTDTLSAYFVDKVVKLSGKNREYQQDIDFLLLGTNKIKWKCSDAPEIGETYSITYNVYPTYIVVKSIPQLRTSENQRIPKKAVVKFAASYSEMTNINKQ